MGGIVAIGETHQLEGFALAGVSVIAAATADEVAAAWHDLAPDTGLAILSTSAAETLRPMFGEHPDILTAVMP